MDVLESLPFAKSEERAQLGTVMTKLAQYCAPRKNHIMAALQFNERKQGEKEPFDSFVTDLKILVKECGYKEDDRMVRDAIVFRCTHEKVREKCLDLGDALTLEKAIDLGRTYEANVESLKKLSHDEDVKINVVNRKPRQRSGNANRNRLSTERRPAATAKEASKEECGNCGYDKSHTNCPAKGQRCNNCKKMNHFSKVCRARKMHSLAEAEESSSEDSDDEFFIGTLGSSSTTEDNQFEEDIEVGGTRVTFQLDSGAKANVMSLETYQNLLRKPEMKKTRTVLISFSKHKLRPCGEAIMTVNYKAKTEDVRFFVVESQVQSILSGETCLKLGLLKRVFEVAAEGKASEKSARLEDYPELFTGLGCLPGEYKIELQEGSRPVVHPPRKIPVAQRQKVIDELKRMEKEGVIVRQEEPTDWVNSLVVVTKPNGSIRLCIDPRDLNNAMKRCHYPMKTVDEVVSRLQGATTFSILDAKQGFWQLKLDEDSSRLCTFNTPIGRYRFTRLPFGVKCAPEIFQRTMDRVLEGLEGVEVIMDDVIVAGNEANHDERLSAFLQRASSNGLRLNRDKCKIRQKEVPYVGHLLTNEGLKVDPQKVKAVSEMPEPTSKTDVKRFLGFVQFLSRFLPQLSTIDAPLRELEKTDVEFDWAPPQQQSFMKIKELVAQAPVLQYYNVEKPVTIQCDASGQGLGAVLLQEGKPVAYTSRSLTDAETRYAPIESEMLAVVFACKKFHQYIYGRRTVVETDHKPLQAIFTKPLAQVPLRLQKMILNLRGYDLEVRYIPGSEQVVADTLSRASLPDTDAEAEAFKSVNVVLAMSDERFAEFQTETDRDPDMKAVMSAIKMGWPTTRKKTQVAARPYWTFRDEMATTDGVIFKGTRIVVPQQLRPAMLDQIHRSHLGISKCQQRAKEVLYWPGMTADIEQKIQSCSRCAEHAKKQPSEPLRPTKPPKLPWNKIGTDLFEFQGQHYLISVCYRSKYPEATKLPSTTSANVIEELKRQFSVHGIPSKVISDNGPQFSSAEFEEFAREYGFKHVTSSPHYPQANGEAERMIQTVKKLWRKNKDKNKALLDYRSTPLPGLEMSPAQLLMGRRLRNGLPISKEMLKPAGYNQQAITNYLERAKELQKTHYDRRAGRELEEIAPGTRVWLQPQEQKREWQPATVIGNHESPRSYVVETDKGSRLRRNRRHLRVCPAPARPTVEVEVREGGSPERPPLPSQPPPQTRPQRTVVAEQQVPSALQTDREAPITTRSGRRVVKPHRLDL